MRMHKAILFGPQGNIRLGLYCLLDGRNITVPNTIQIAIHNGAHSRREIIQPPAHGVFYLIPCVFGSYCVFIAFIRGPNKLASVNLGD